MSQNQTELTLVPQGQTATEPDTQITVERLKLWIAVLSLAAALAVGVFSIYQSNLQSQRLRTVTVAIKDTDEIRTALQKPLEGVWQYRMVFSKYFGQDVTYIASGTTIILWDAAKQQYQVFIGYSIAKEWQHEKLVTAFVGGTLPADELGWPPDNFNLAMKYMERTGVDQFASPLAVGFTFDSGKYEKSADGKLAMQIKAHYENPRSIGEMTMSR